MSGLRSVFAAMVALVVCVGVADRVAAQGAAPAQEDSSRPDTLQPGDAFGEEITLSEQTIVYFTGTGKWENAFETIADALKTVKGYLEKQGIKPAGSPMTIYTSTTDSVFHFEAAVPVAEPPKEAPTGDLSVGKTTAGRAFKFVHRGSYDDMDTTYDAITNFLDEKQLEAKGPFIEQYVTDPIATPQDKLVVEVYVPVK